MAPGRDYDLWRCRVRKWGCKDDSASAGWEEGDGNGGFSAGAFVDAGDEVGIHLRVVRLRRFVFLRGVPGKGEHAESEQHKNNPPPEINVYSKGMLLICRVA